MTPITETVFGAYVLPLIALAGLFLILGWFVLMTRGKKPLNIRLKGFGVEIDISPQQPNRKETP